MKKYLMALVMVAALSALVFTMDLLKPARVQAAPYFARWPKAVFLHQADTGDDRYVLIEKGSNTGIVLKGFAVDWKADGAAAWTVEFGALLTDSATTGDAALFYEIPIQSAGADSGTAVVNFEPGLDVYVTGGAWSNLVSGVLDQSSVWTNDSTTLVCAGGDTCPADAGDIVVIIDEVSGSATFTVGITGLYETY